MWRQMWIVSIFCLKWISSDSFQSKTEVVALPLFKTWDAHGEIGARFSSQSRPSKWWRPGAVRGVICTLLPPRGCIKYNHTSTLLWRRKWQPTPVFLPGKMPWTEEPGGIRSRGSQRVGHDWATSLSLSTLSSSRGKYGGSGGKNICLPCRRPGFHPWVGEIPWRRE